MDRSDRDARLCRWVAQRLGTQAVLEPLAGDASFRRYFRVCYGERRFVLMDAPPPMEDVAPFLRVRAWLESAGVRVPALYGVNEAEGMLLLEDLGDTSWASHRSAGGDLSPLFEDALRQLHQLQAADTASIRLPHFDQARMLRECALFCDWYLPCVARVRLDSSSRTTMLQALSPYLRRLSALPRVPVHLDFHSRNLMLPQGRTPLGVIDFQDAMFGPVTYDLASLLYDCYQDYSEAMRRDWSRRFFDALPASLASYFTDFEAWHRMLRLTAWQRHIKAIGIFARLAYRDGKRQFLDEIPLTRKHLMEEMDALAIHDAWLALLQAPPREA
ncbi:MAG: hypothetical protein D6678_07170 [Zetaproteobacteria bacterium]|nr:MAG: hypothetical protein D6678_07170 [Zetaproteobacteria bacterium]